MGTPEITLDDGKGRIAMIPAGRNGKVKREGACSDRGPHSIPSSDRMGCSTCEDVVLHGQVMIGIPICISILLRTDGSWSHWTTDYAHCEDSYLELEEGQIARWEDGRPHYELPPATEAQIKTVAKWVLNPDWRPYGMPLGISLCQWAFAGMTPQEVSDKFGTGERIYLGGGD